MQKTTGAAKLIIEHMTGQQLSAEACKKFHDVSLRLEGMVWGCLEN